MSRTRPLLPITFADLEKAAQQQMSPEAFAYIAGGAGREQTIQQNHLGFQQWKILPRMLRDVGNRDTRIQLLGRSLPSPFVLAPIGVLELAHPQADLAVAQAAAQQQVPMIFSNQASFSMEACSAQMGSAPRWFQLYWSKSNELVKSLVQRAERTGCEAIVVTLDTTMLGWRPRDLTLAYLPFLEGLGIAQYISDPVFQDLVAQTEEGASSLQPKVNWTTLRKIVRLMWRYPGGFWENLRSKKPLRAVRTFIDIYSRPTLTWADLAFLRQQTTLPILLKGILDPQDARLAVDHEVDGIIVSNHGGRQVDGAVSAIEVLPAIVEIVDNKIPILLDSGIRTGADAFKALALGAKAVGIGRPYVYALALGGAQGVVELLQNFQAEFELTMGLAGCQSIAEIGRDRLWMEGKN
ncbi:MAG: alpha-hydroxy-acid oxidizing protein [Bacteroidota bacterium]